MSRKVSTRKITKKTAANTVSKAKNTSAKETADEKEVPVRFGMLPVC